jgi:hypothetical protein
MLLHGQSHNVKRGQDHINHLLRQKPFTQESMATMYGLGDMHSFHPITYLQSSIRGK